MSHYPFDPTPESDEEALEQTQPMEPLRRSPLSDRQRVPLTPRREPIKAILEQIEEDDEEPEEEEPPEVEIALPVREPRPGYREVDPIFAYLVLVSLAIGLSSFDATLRYIILWTLMGSMGAMGYLMGAVQRMRETHLDDLIWGIAFGFLSGFPFLLVFGDALGTVSTRMFDVPDTPPHVMDSWVFMAAAFVIPAAETLFFRGAVQGVRDIFFTSAIATLWSGLLFFPVMSLSGRFVIGLILLIVFTLLNFMFSYVRFRNGLAGAWLCQTVSYTLLWFFPRILF